MAVQELINVLRGFKPDLKVVATIRDGDTVRGVRYDEESNRVLLCGTQKSS